MRAALSVIVLAALAACATSRPTYLPDGRLGHSVTCSGAALSWANCETKAGDLCKANGYDVASATQDGAPIVWGQATTQTAQITAGTVINRTMLIACK